MSARVEKLPDTDTYYMGIAIAVREKANCTGNRVGAVLVLENRVISTGYNAEWYSTRLQENSRRPQPQEMRGIFAGLGLEGDFWDPSSDSFGSRAV